jgi:hypothetical protein
MTTIEMLAGYLGGAILTTGLVVYLLAIAKGKASSNRVTWGIWILINALFCFSYYEANGLVASIWVPLVYLLGTVAVFLFLLKFGQPGYWTWVEKTALIGVAVIMVLWFMYQSPIATLTFTLLIDILGAIPLIATVWKDPSADYAPAWYFGFAANTFNLFAIEQWDYANASYPLYLVILTLTVSVLVGFPKFLRFSKASG